MNKNKHLLVTLFLYALTGVSACALYTNRDSIPVSIESSHPKSAVLAPPVVVSKKDDTSVIQTKIDAIEEVKTDETIISENVTENIDNNIKYSEEEPYNISSDITYEPKYTYTTSHSSGRLFIRDGASMDNKIISFMRPGTTGDVISISDEWVFLKYNDIEGYVYKGYLNLTEKK